MSRSNADPHRNLRIRNPHMTGRDVRGAQRHLHVTVDGEYGPNTRAAGRQWVRRAGGSVQWFDRRGLTRKMQRILRGYRTVPVAWRRRARKRAAATTLRERAYHEAVRLVGVMEQGGNNVGREVEQIIREGGGIRGQAWCGWFMACVYKRAGSRAIDWRMGAVRLWLGIGGVRRTSNPQRGDAVRFTFDHIGMFVRDLGNGYIETIEGNTGASGAVSDSATGGDGVYRKRRHKSLVRDYLEITK